MMISSKIKRATTAGAVCAGVLLALLGARHADAQEMSAGDIEKAKVVYAQTCITCHGPGVAGAPKFGDKVAWEPRIKLGREALYKSALKGKRGMPPKGGHFQLADDDVKLAVDYMVSVAK